MEPRLISFCEMPAMHKTCTNNISCFLGFSFVDIRAYNAAGVNEDG